jgi:hypothetical protein
MLSVLGKIQKCTVQLVTGQQTGWPEDYSVIPSCDGDLCRVVVSYFLCPRKCNVPLVYWTQIVWHINTFFWREARSGFFVLLSGYAMTRAVSCSPHSRTAEAQVESQASPCGICDAQSGAGTGVSLSTSFFPCQCNLTNASYWSIYSSPVLWRQFLLSGWKCGRDM